MFVQCLAHLAAMVGKGVDLEAQVADRVGLVGVSHGCSLGCVGRIVAWRCGALVDPVPFAV